MSDPTFLSTEQLAQHLGISTRQAYRLISDGTIPDCQQRIGNVRVWTPAEILAAEQALAKYSLKISKLKAKLREHSDAALARLGGRLFVPTASERLSGKASPMIDAETLARLLKLTLKQIYRATSSEAERRYGARLPVASKDGARILFRATDVLAWLAKVRQYRDARRRVEE